MTEKCNKHACSLLKCQHQGYIWAAEMDATQEKHSSETRETHPQKETSFFCFFLAAHFLLWGASRRYLWQSFHLKHFLPAEHIVLNTKINHYLKVNTSLVESEELLKPEWNLLIWRGTIFFSRCENINFLPLSYCIYTGLIVNTNSMYYNTENPLQHEIPDEDHEFLIQIYQSALGLICHYLQLCWHGSHAGTQESLHIIIQKPLIKTQDTTAFFQLMLLVLCL